MNKTSIYAEKRADFIKAKGEIEEWLGTIELIHKGEVTISNADPVMIAKMANFIITWCRTTDIWFSERRKHNEKDRSLENDSRGHEE